MDRLVFDRDSNTFLYAINAKNEYMPLEKIDKEDFLSALESYEKAKANYLNSIHKNN